MDDRSGHGDSGPYRPEDSGDMNFEEETDTMCCDNYIVADYILSFA